MRWTGILCAALVAACAPKDEGVTVVRLPNGGYQLTLTAADLTDTAQGQKLLLPAAIQLCGERGIAFGANAFDKTGALPRLVQELRCEAPSADPTAPMGFAPSTADEETVARLSERFLNARDAGDLAAARELFPPQWPEAEQRAWAVRVSDFNRLAGPETKQAISRTGWFENPPAATAPGVYAAVDYVRAYEKVKTACGFIVWRRQADGAWRIDREKLNFLTPEQEARTPRDDLPEVRVNMGCR